LHASAPENSGRTPETDSLVLAALALVPGPDSQVSTATWIQVAPGECELTNAVYRARNGDGPRSMLLCVEAGRDGAMAAARVRRWAEVVAWRHLSIGPAAAELRRLASMGEALEAVRAAALLCPDRAAFVLANDLDVVGIVPAHIEQRLDALGWDELDQSAMVLAVREAVLNAILHGNLAVSGAHRETEDTLRRIVDERRHVVPYSHRRVIACVGITVETVTCSVVDEGRGFDVATLADPTTPDNVLRPTGRGVSLIKALVDEVRFNPAGNAITMTKRRLIETGPRSESRA
jgi:anti-sigma regulatory factor (Ser/Thr protein kinase)